MIRTKANKYFYLDYKCETTKDICKVVKSCDTFLKIWKIPSRYTFYILSYLKFGLFGVLIVILPGFYTIFQTKMIF